MCLIESYSPNSDIWIQKILSKRYMWILVLRQRKEQRYSKIKTFQKTVKSKMRRSMGYFFPTECIKDKLLLCHTLESGMKPLRDRKETTPNHPYHIYCSNIVLLPCKSFWKPLFSPSESLFRLHCSHSKCPKAEPNRFSDWISSWHVTHHRLKRILSEDFATAI